jgi:hypothetical protein
MSPQTTKNQFQLGPEKRGGWSWRLTVFSFLVLITVVVIYLGLEVGYKLYLNSQIEERDAAIAQLSETIPKEDQERFVSFYSQLANLQLLLDKHSKTSTVMPFLEKNTNRSVYFDFVDLRYKDRRLTLGGVASSYAIFSQQLEAFSRAPEVERLVVSESQSIGGRVNFRLFVTLKPVIFE